MSKNKIEEIKHLKNTWNFITRELKEERNDDKYGRLWDERIEVKEKIDNLQKELVGDSVIYEPTGEKGIIKSFSSHNDKTVFVVYKCGEDWGNWQNYTAQGTDIEDLINN